MPCVYKTIRMLKSVYSPNGASDVQSAVASLKIKEMMDGGELGNLSLDNQSIPLLANKLAAENEISASAYNKFAKTCSNNICRDNLPPQQAYDTLVKLIDSEEDQSIKEMMARICMTFEWLELNHPKYKQNQFSGANIDFTKFLPVF